jgi:phenylacetate-coenzyme A ligase PaaK-like adenylate-forming protein
MSTRTLWKGQWKNFDTPEQIAGELERAVSGSLGREVRPKAVLDACQSLGRDLENGRIPELRAALRALGMSENKIEAVIKSIAAVFNPDFLEQKYMRELGSLEPFTARRPDFREPILEAWAPLGVLLHVVPSNSPTVAPLSVLEGLMAGNVNILKNTARNGDFPLLLLKALADADLTGTIASMLFGLTVSSQETVVMNALYEAADGVAVWGGDDTVSAVRSAVGAQVKVIEWGHKISFSCFSRSGLHDKQAMQAVAHDVCVIEQQACSSPQCILVETEDRKQLHDFSHRFAAVLQQVSAQYPQSPPSTAEAAEVTTSTLMAEYEACLGKGEVIADPGGVWRVLVRDNPGLAPSPLYRTVIIMPFARRELTCTLRPYRGYLQTAGLSCAPKEVAELTEALFHSGVTRVVQPGEMLQEYSGQPHDGAYALQRYSRRVSVNRDRDLQNIAGFHDFHEPESLPSDAPIMTKQDFISTEMDHSRAEVYFRSGGTTGTPKASAFSWDDYAEQMAAAAEGLIAAGLDPKNDRCANLYHCGNMYGSFISFWSILEHARAVQLPIGMVDDFAQIAESIVRFRANTILSMPFFAAQLFESQAERLLQYGGIKKVFLSGEHLSPDLQREFCEKHGVSLVRSAIYGSNDAGVLGYACEYCESGVYHVMDRLQYVEIVDVNSDSPVPSGGTGRVVVSTRNRKAQRIRRYDIGDLARHVDEPCPCGRKAPRIRLLGRHGDIFKLGPLLSISAFSRALEKAGYSRNMQIVLSGKGGGRTLLTVRLEQGYFEREQIKAALMEHVPGLDTVVGVKVAEVEIQATPPGGFEINESTGKLRLFIDRRSEA